VWVFADYSGGYKNLVGTEKGRKERRSSMEWMIPLLGYPAYSGRPIRNTAMIWVGEKGLGP